MVTHSARSCNAVASFARVSRYELAISRRNDAVWRKLCLAWVVRGRAWRQESRFPRGAPVALPFKASSRMEAHARQGRGGSKSGHGWPHGATIAASLADLVKDPPDFGWVFRVHCRSSRIIRWRITHRRSVRCSRSWAVSVRACDRRGVNRVHHEAAVSGPASSRRARLLQRRPCR